MAPAIFIDLTGEDSGDEVLGVGDIDQSMVRAAAKPNADYEYGSSSNAIPVRLQDTPLLPPLPPFPVQTDPANACDPDYLLRDYRSIVKSNDWSKVKNFHKWDRDPNTTARDVLASTGRGSPGLNHHLLPLLNNVTHVDEDSDLATIHWDLVGARRSSLVCRPPRNTTMRSSSEEAHHDGQNFPARSPLKPTRGDVMSGGLEASSRPSSTLPSTSPDNHASDTGFFVRTFDPTPGHGQSYPSGGWGVPHPQFNSELRMQRAMMTDSLVPSTRAYESPYASDPSGRFGLDGQLMSRNSEASQDASPSPQPAKPSLSVVLNPFTPASFYGQSEISRSPSRSLDESRSSSDPLNPAQSYKARRGRPPKGSSFVIEIPSATPQKRGRPFAKPQHDPHIDPNHKKRGRPFATAESAAKAAAKAAARAAAASDSGDGLAKKRGRPFKIRTQVSIPVPEPIYIPFLCEWKGCLAELHNLETLEAHVFNVHNKKQPSGGRLCLWGKCGLRNEASAEAAEVQIHDEKNEIKTKTEWKSHINQRHLIPFAWHMGDGPKGTSLTIRTNSDPSPWLKDENGQQVTPSVRTQLIEEGRAKENNARRFVRTIDGIYWIYERIKSPEAYMKVQVQIPQVRIPQVQIPQTGNTSDGDDEDDIQMGYL